MLLGLYHVGNRMPGKLTTGATDFMQASVISPSLWFGLWLNEDMSTAEGLPPGLPPGAAYSMPMKPGGMSSHNLVTGDGVVSFANLAGGKLAEAALTGSGTISNADGYMLIAAAAAITASGDLTADIQGRVEAVASLVGDGAITAAITGLSEIVAALTGSGTVSDADLRLILSATAAIAGSGDITDASLLGGLAAAADLLGSGTVTDAAISGRYATDAALVGSGTASSANGTGIGFPSAALVGSGALAATTAAPGLISADITSQGEILTTANVAEFVWARVCEGNLAAIDALRLILAVQTGKSTVVDNGGGSATVTFRDTTDTLDRVIADMQDSERQTVTLDPTET